MLFEVAEIQNLPLLWQSHPLKRPSSLLQLLRATMSAEHREQDVAKSPGRVFFANFRFCQINLKKYAIFYFEFQYDVI